MKPLKSLRALYPFYQSFWLSQHHLDTIKKAMVLYGVRTKAKALRLIIENFDNGLPKQP
jgi:hypothetical protein